jgi:phosphate transport system protein
MLLYLLSSIRKIERAGDSLKKIGEEIIYHLEAKVIKHSEKKNSL